MSGPDDPFSFDAEFGDPDYVKSARDPNLPPQTGKEWVDSRASDIPVTEGGERSPFADLDHEAEAVDGAASQERTGGRAGADDRNPADDFSDEFETAAAPADDLPPPPGAPMVEHALYYARRGWPVFPCKPTNKAPFFAGGFHVATTDEKTIRGWWGYWPKAMIGVPMGPRSGVWAVDPDPPKEPGEPDGRRIWDDFLIEHEHGEHVATHTELTPRGGYHIVFKWDPNRPVTNSPGALAKTNIDVRGEGGYIIVAPSVCLGDGTPKNVAGQYCVSENFFHFAIAPDWLYDLILKKPEPKPTPKPAPTESPPRSSTESDNGKLFWRKVNDIAFQNLGAWVPDIFGSAAVYQPNTGAWRIKSEALGRENDEDLSIHPSGVTDWGVWDIGDPRGGRRSAIDIVIEFGRKHDAAEAALWLCERCGVDPVSLGWQANGAEQQGRQQGPQQGPPGAGHAPQQSPPLFELFWHGKEYNRELRSWLVKGLILETGQGLASGQWGTAKTFTVLDLAASVMSITPFAGREVVRQGGVLFVAAEGAYEIPIRLKGVVEEKLRPAALASGTVDLENLPFAWIEDCPNLQDNGDFNRLIATAKQAAQNIRDQFDLPLALIVIDTLSAAGNFKDANDAAEGQRIMNRLGELSRQTGAFVLAVDHFGKAVETGTRGSSAKEAAADVVLALLADREINGTISNMRLALRKLRGGKVGTETPFDLRVVNLGFETTCVVEWMADRTPPQGAGAARERWPRSLRIFKAALETTIIHHGKPMRPFASKNPGDDDDLTVGAVPLDAVRFEFVAAYPAEGGDAKAKRETKLKAFKRALKQARDNGLVGSREIGVIDYVWLVEPASAARGEQ